MFVKFEMNKLKKMIHEITRFIDYLEENSPDIFSENLKLKDGLYFFLEKVGDELIANENRVLSVNMDTEVNSLYNEFLLLTSNTEMLNAMKSYNSGPKVFIDIGSPFGISISGLGLSNGIIKNLNAVDAYFKAASKYVDEYNNKHIEWMNEFKHFVKTKMFEYIGNREEYKNVKKGDMFYFFLREPTLEDYQVIQTRFLAEKLFNKEKFNIKTKEGEVYGISDSLSGFNDSKEFLKHQTSTIELNYRVTGIEAYKLYKFFRLQQRNKILPNPMPLFVDEQELTDKAIKFFISDKKAGHKEIIEALLKTRDRDLQNYYLIFFHNGKKGSRIVDLDFVPVFRYKLENVKIQEPFKIGGKLTSLPVSNVFEFQQNILNKIFNNQLVTTTKSGRLWIKYFDDMVPKPKSGNATDVIVDLFYKYRKSIYDYVYKSRIQVITHSMFDEMMKKSILDDIRHDKGNDKEYRIKEKLNIWFSLYNYFNHTLKLDNMVNKTELLFEKIKTIANPENTSERIRTDEEFAFASGQLIRTILNKSEAGERSHAMLEPFLQKTESEQFKLSIAREFEKYKHAFKFYKGDKNRYDFDKIMSEVMGFETGTNIKTLLPLLLAGYFSETIFKKENNTDSINQ